MVLARIEGNKLVIDLSEKELKELELNAVSDFEVIKAKKGIWVLLESQKPDEQRIKKEKKPVEKSNDIEQKIIELLRKKNLQNRVEGKFESLLSPTEQITFKKMLEENKVERFKLNEKYKKSVYRMPEVAVKKSFVLTEKNMEDYSLDKDGFVIAKTEFAAARLSEKLGDRIKKGEVRGTRAFSGEFFIIDSSLFNEKSRVVLEIFKTKKNVTLLELKAALKMPATLIRIICTFLSEDGMILERRKEQYQFID